MNTPKRTFPPIGLSLVLALFLLAACTVPGVTPTPAPATDTPPPAATDTPRPAPSDTPTSAASEETPGPSATPTPEPQPEPTTGILSGAIMYPSEGIPPLRLYALELNSGDYASLDTAQNQTSYELEVPPGVYHIFAYAFLDTATPLAGGYTAYAACGLSVDCPDDHSLIEVAVEAGERVEGVDVSDWYGEPAGGFPPPPDQPLPAAVLPAPLYVLDASGQIIRLERDATRARPITDAASPVTDFDVSSFSGEIAYVSGNELHVAGALGGNDRVIFTAPNPDPDLPSGGPHQIHFLTFSPGGGRIAFALEGVQVIDIASGVVDVIQPNEPVDSPGAGTYFPLAWAPDGTRLLIHRAFFTTSGTLQVNSVGFDSVVQLGTGCCNPTWSPDGRYVYVSGPYYGPRVEPGLRRHDTYMEGAKEVLIGLDLSSDELHLTNFARLLANDYLYSFQRVIGKADYSAANGVPPFYMVRTAPDGVSDREQLREEGVSLAAALWAADGSGAAAIPLPANNEADTDVLWLATDNSPARALPVTVPVDYNHRLSWGASEIALTAASLRAQFLADSGIAVAPEGEFDGFTGAHALPLVGDPRPEEARAATSSLWAVHTVGMRRYGEGEDQPHLLAIYVREGDSWRRLAQHPLADPGNAEDPGADYLGAEGVQQVQVEPQNLWLEINAGVGAHGGTYRLVRFDGSDLIDEVMGFSSSPGAGRVEDLNGDGLGEAVLDATDYYVFCYACGVRLVHYNVFRWNGEAMMGVGLNPLPQSDSSLVALNNRAVAQANAGLWKDALDTVSLIMAQSQSDDTGTVAWNTTLIELNAGAKRQAAQDGEGYPILENLFYGDYRAAVEPFSQYSPEQIFAQPSALVVNTVAAGWEEAVRMWVFDTTEQALAYFEENGDRATDAAAAYFLRAWAAYITDPTDPAAMEAIGRAVQLTTSDPLYEPSFAYIKTQQGGL